MALAALVCGVDLRGCDRRWAPAFLCYCGRAARARKIEVRADQPIHRMAGGMGASWHAIHREVPFDPDRMTSGRRGAPQGSGFGGNPPLESTAAWQDLERHFRWLGLDWCRVELAQRIYHPERDRFDWDNAEMRTLYRILDVCESNRVDVFLTQMWNDLDWNMHDGVHPLQSAPKSIPDFARGLGELCERLLRHRRYTCIRWLCINNEPGEDWGGGWGRADSRSPSPRAFGPSAPNWTDVGWPCRCPPRTSTPSPTSGKRRLISTHWWAPSTPTPTPSRRRISPASRASGSNSPGHGESPYSFRRWGTSRWAGWTSARGRGYTTPNYPSPARCSPG
jgi:hypothetical protein